MPRVYLLVLLSVLAACGAKIPQPPDKVFAACMSKVAPPQPFADVSEHDRRYMIACMGRAGLAFDPLLADCNRELAPTTLLKCYKAAK